MKVLFDTGIVNKITHGVKVLGQGSQKIEALGVPITMEVSNATERAIEAIKNTGGSIKMIYRTPLIMKQYLKPHKFPEWQGELKTPMPAPKVLKKLEKLKVKGLDVEYPSAPWFTDNVEQIKLEKAERERRIAEAQNASYLSQLPADRSPVPDRVRVQRKQLYKKHKYV
jgi:large subunit ribosomal protein L15